jgi:hypothetical protein
VQFDTPALLAKPHQCQQRQLELFGTLVVDEAGHAVAKRVYLLISSCDYGGLASVSPT